MKIIKSRDMRWAGQATRRGEKRKPHRILVGKPEGKCSLGRSRRRCEDSIRKDGVVWTGFLWLEMGTSGRVLRHDSEPVSSVSCFKILE
jgi:hypothetical protein